MKAKVLDGKTAVVTGGGAGIGKAIARTLAAEGARVAVCDIDNQSAEKTAEEIRSERGTAQAYKADAADSRSVAEVAEKILAEFGAVDILVNNAGITKDNLIIRMSDSEWNDVLNVNLKGVFNFTKAFVPGMLRRRSGKIISISSVVGIMGNAGQANYAASKAGVIGFTKALAKELAPRGINVNAVAPGFIKTKMTEGLTEQQRSALLERIPFSRFGEPDDVARSVLFLASELSDYVTGQVLVVDGGMVM